MMPSIAGDFAATLRRAGVDAITAAAVASNLADWARHLAHAFDWPVHDVVLAFVGALRGDPACVEPFGIVLDRVDTGPTHQRAMSRAEMLLMACERLAVD